MKRKLALLAAVLLLVSLFAGCGNGGSSSGSGGGTATAAPTAAPSSGGSSGSSGGGEAAATPEPEPEPDSPYNLAPGKYDVNEKGIPLQKYTYELPLSTTDEVFTYWTSPVLPDQIDSGDYAGMPFPAALAEKTGVHLEYILVSMSARMENFSTLIASDDVPNLVSDYEYYYPRGILASIEDGFSVNLYDYKEYMPNYYYCIWDHEDDLMVRAKLMQNDHTIASFACLNDERVISYGGAVRGDWIDKLGISVSDIITIDDLHDVLAAFQSQLGCEHPFVLLNCLDAHHYMNCFDTICQYTGTVAPLFVKDGKVQFACSTEGDKNYMTTMNQWFNEGFISPNWLNWDGNITFAGDLQTGCAGVTSMLASESTGYVDTETYPGSYWTAIHEPVLYEGQVLHLGDTASWLQGIGSWAIGTSCQNIPLLVSYCDWFYSDEGMFFANYGVEGYTFNYNENGEPELTDMIVNNVSGASWAILQFAMNDVYEGGILMRSRSYAFKGGEQLRAWYDVWNDPNYYRYDGSMAWPDAMNYSNEDSSYLATVGTDIQTFIGENYLQFVDGSKSMAQWDEYVDTLTHLTGWEEAKAIYQDYYDEFMATH
ncbi:MAG: hypothetical protein IKP17_02970 [Oscillospiraceae bacterium]|nr:hypothetical protein [Oscillospiraceae bacterium]MBR4691703.1 hypothetical protein [Oscillospiraceae bacterium]